MMCVYLLEIRCIRNALIILVLLLLRSCTGMVDEQYTLDL